MVTADPTILWYHPDTLCCHGSYGPGCGLTPNGEFREEKACKYSLWSIISTFQLIFGK